MARKAEFSINGQSIMAELKKVDRKKIYGWSTIEVFDENGSKCKLAGLAEGQFVMPSGSTALVTLNAKGEAVSKSTLVGVDSDGKKVEKVPSIYDEKVMLREATIDEYLSTAVKSVYQLQVDENKEALLNELNNGKVYYFVFNYRADYEGDDAFLISNGTDAFAVTGMSADLEFIGLEDNEQELVPEETEAVEDDDMDFAMF
ncbi:MAG: hypothetical protein HOK72_03025 [Flavobacteriales bacterium]|jgi:hypothetical protein|nr:hypothetical protein [Flavobacteriales bacterium]MDA7748194.1 hypothetical protein [Bacteroidia bacterium]|tara:strand:- start:686 stop:1291 length:606 start_codon:yes stop_codon:yes gene_type:complete